jgi:hypothetical protein
MSKMKKLLILIITFINISNAFGMPDWYLQAPDNASQDVIYGNGSAPTKEEAVNVALNDALSKIRTTVGSVIKNESVSTNNKISDEISIRITNEVEKFSLSGYETSKMDYVRKEKLFYAQVKVDKLKIYREKFVEYEAEAEVISGLFKSAQNSDNLFDKLQFASKLEKKAENAKKNIYILYALRNTFPFQEELRKNNEYLALKSNILNETGFQVEGNDQIAKALKEVISELKLKSHGKNLVKISFSIPEKPITGMVYGSYYSKTMVHIEMKEADKSFFSVNLNTGGTSTINTEEAYIQSLQDLKRQFKDKISTIIK